MPRGIDLENQTNTAGGDLTLSGMLSDDLQNMPDNILYRGTETSVTVSQFMMCSEGETQPDHRPFMLRMIKIRKSVFKYVDGKIL